MLDQDTGPWYGRDCNRILFEREAGRAFAYRARTVRGVGRFYRMDLAVPHYEARKVDIQFSKAAPTLPRVCADGPTSPHRFEDGALCMWYPGDSAASRWLHKDGLLELICHIQAHLFREAWWRETGEWPGPEAPHDVPQGGK